MTDTPTDFVSASTWQLERPGLTVGSVPAGWSQGRATFGGLVAAIGVRPMLARVAPDRWLRSAQVSFAAPLAAAPAQCHTEVLREGRALTVVESRIEQEGSVRCVVNASFAADRASSAVLVPPRPPVPGPEHPSVEVPFMPDRMPAFLQHFATRWDNGVYPGSSSQDAHVLGACRFRDEARDADVCDVLALLDVWPPALVTMLPKRASAASTVSWTLDFLAPLPSARIEAWWSYEVRAVAARGGYGQTSAMLWSPGGDAVLRSTQLVAVFE